MRPPSVRALQVNIVLLRLVSYLKHPNAVPANDLVKQKQYKMQLYSWHAYIRYRCRCLNYSVRESLHTPVRFAPGRSILLSGLAEYNAQLKHIAIAYQRVVNEKRATLFRNRGKRRGTGGSERTRVLHALSDGSLTTRPAEEAIPPPFSFFLKVTHKKKLPYPIDRNSCLQ